MTYLTEILAGLKILSWLGARARRIFRHMSPRGYISKFRPIGKPVNGHQDIYYFHDGSAKWLVRSRHPAHPATATPSEIAETIDLAGPYCPECEAELVEQAPELNSRREEEDEREPIVRHFVPFIPFYNWSCPVCHFHTTSETSASETRVLIERQYRIRHRDNLAGI